ncbi:DMT family transporter [Cohnella sp. 56]|uniref:DMT family transporter n=1 Tax=Cohnella sp. 56 TaxID=3113722 RepID=UPI0030E7D497
MTTPASEKSSAATYTLALLYAIIIGFSFMFTKLALQHADPLDMLAYRFALSYAVLAVPARLGWIRIPKPEPGTSRRPLLLVGLIYPTAFFAFQAIGISASTTSGAGVFSSTAPIFALLLGALMLKERASLFQMLSVLVSIGGLVFMTSAGGSGLQGMSVLGGTMMLLSAAMLALYGVLVRRHRAAYTAIQLSYAMMRTGCMIFVALALVRHAVQGTMPALLAPSSAPGFWLPLLYIAIMSSLVSSWLSNVALARIEAFKVSLFTNLGNLISILSGVLLMGDHWSGAQTIGSICLLAGVIGANYRGFGRRRDRPAAKGETAAPPSAQAGAGSARLARTEPTRAAAAANAPSTSISPEVDIR